MEQKWKLYFSDPTRDRKIFAATFFMFLFLAIETIFSCTIAKFHDGHMIFFIQMSIPKILCALIYLSTSILVASAVRYKFLLIPDFFLLIIKLYIAIKAFFTLEHDPENMLANLETAIESLLFSLFLATMILGKLLKHHPLLTSKSPFIGLWALLMCFPFTLGFEIAKLLTVLNENSTHTAIAVFNFIKGTVHEIALDIPYALLIITMYFIPEKTFKAFRRH